MGVAHTQNLSLSFDGMGIFEDYSGGSLASGSGDPIRGPDPETQEHDESSDEGNIATEVEHQEVQMEVAYGSEELQ